MITRYNYEEYFFLYVDNELAATERMAVEEFIRQHPDLEEELVLLKKSVVQPENNISFRDKYLLLKHADEQHLININNYEEYFLLYLDNELDELTKKQVEEFLGRNQSLQNEFSLLKQARLKADDSIVFEGKEALYKGSKRRKPMPLFWISAAAAVAGLLIVVFLFLEKNDTYRTSPHQTVAEQATDGTNNAVAQKDIKTGIKKIVPVTSSASNPLNNDQPISKDIINRGTKSQQHQTAMIQDQFTNRSEGKKQADAFLTTTSNTDSSASNNLVSANISKPQIIDEPVAVIKTDIAPDKIVVVVDNSFYEKDQNSKSSYTKLSATENESYADNDSEKRNKLRSVFRRVSRVFNKPSDDDSNNKRSVAIGSFQIALR